MDKKDIQYGNEGEELIPGKTENLSSTYHNQSNEALPHDTVDRETEYRGEKAGFDRRTGEVHGSGSNAGGGGAPDEDYDQDQAGGSGISPTRTKPEAPPQAPRK